MRRLLTAAIALSLLVGCSATKGDSQAIGAISGAQPSTSQVPVSTPRGQWINLGNNGVVNVSYQATSSTSQDHSYWAKIDFNQVSGNDTRTQVMLQVPQCNQGVYYTHYLINLNSSGQIVRQGVPDDVARLTVVDPDSLAGDAFRIACSTH